jgi:hypothetical protein
VVALARIEANSGFVARFDDQQDGTMPVWINF